MDRIVLHDIIVQGRHGAYAQEREQPQTLRIDLVLQLDLSRAAASDDLADTLDYADVYRRIVRSSRRIRTRFSNVWQP